MIYFIQSNKDAIKIGYTKNELTFKTRLINLKPSNPGILTILNLISGGPHLEKALHKKFSFCRIHGEWFDPTSELLFFIENPQPQCDQLKNDYSTEKENYSENNNSCKQCGYRWYKSARFQTTCPWCSSTWAKPEPKEIKVNKTKRSTIDDSIINMAKSAKADHFEYIIDNSKFKAITESNKPKIKLIKSEVKK